MPGEHSGGQVSDIVYSETRLVFNQAYQGGKHVIDETKDRRVLFTSFDHVFRQRNVYHKSQSVAEPFLRQGRILL